MKKGDANWYFISAVALVVLIYIMWWIFFSENGLRKIFG